MTRAFHALPSVEPLSPTTTPQEVTALSPVFFTVTFAQYPVPHCDCSARSASMVPSGLFNPESTDSLSSWSESPEMQPSDQHATEAEMQLSK
ncbi:hypothetical protein BE21_20740 [Sorangium cellulosum]|uniref:Uncharacterized protein n=1 Tax=Sorangium cellulosum TaxID=56 RepID=A0A150TW80_SORCE|nr:hypothetical protein BE21_20740 [Sorangium cellulosum]